MRAPLTECKSDSWTTPPDIVDRVKRVLGTIHLDPASSHDANALIGAKRILTVDDDALNCRWPRWKSGASAYLNPPGGKIGNRSKALEFWRRLIEYRDAGNLRDAIFMAFSIHSLQVFQQFEPHPMQFPFCVPRFRIGFGASKGGMLANALIYVPGSVDRADTFAEVFSEIGTIARGVQR